MRVFVLGTGRTGSVTFGRACRHISNYTSSHEARLHLPDGNRILYPDDHIEIDNRLSWFGGLLLDRYDKNDLIIVHLLRDEQAVVESYARRWPSQGLPHVLRNPRLMLRRAALVPPPKLNLGYTFAHGIHHPDHVLTTDEREDSCRLLVQSVRANVELIIQQVPPENRFWIWIEHPTSVFVDLLERIGAEGDLDAALEVLGEVHNASPPQERA